MSECLIGAAAVGRDSHPLSQTISQPKILIHPKTKLNTTNTGMKIRPEIIYQDEAIIIVNKPPNYLAIPDRFVADRPNVLRFLQQKFEEVFTVHRIDRATSGILVFARNEEAHRNLSQQFQNRQVDKTYLALVEGQLHLEEGTIDKPITKHPVIAGKMIINRNGKPSVSHYKVVERFKNYTLLEVKIETGRTHQIRVHLENIGYPLAVDEIYGRKAAFYLSEVKLKKYNSSKNETERPLMSRSTLHAAKLSFTHPTSQERQTVTGALPKDFSALLKQLRKWGK